MLKKKHPNNFWLFLTFGFCAHIRAFYTLCALLMCIHTHNVYVQTQTQDNPIFYDTEKHTILQYSTVVLYRIVSAD